MLLVFRKTLKIISVILKNISESSQNFHIVVMVSALRNFLRIAYGFRDSDDEGM